MAEGLARQMAPEGVEVCSAGSEPTRVNPFAVRAMEQIGIDIGDQRSKSVDDIDKDRIGTVITLCAEELCPVFPATVPRQHWPLEDPAAVAGSDQDRLAAFTRVREQIRGKLEAYFRRSE